MIRETDIEIIVNRKSDIELIKKAIINNNIQFPVLIAEYENSYCIEIYSDYEEWDLDSAILKEFPDYELTENPDKGRKEIRLQIARTQSPFATDNWGRPIEDPTNEIKYLIKKSAPKTESFVPEVKVLFEDKEYSYFVNIIDGINKNTNEKGFLLCKDFKTKYIEGDIDFLKDRLYKSREEAFSTGIIYIKEQATIDFKDYLENQKKEVRKQQRLPRKIIRDFIKACNSSDVNGIIKDLDENVIFEETINWQKEVIFEGIKNLKIYIKSSNQILCSKNLQIKSNWFFELPKVTIWIEYNENTNEDTNHRKYDKWSFILNDNKIKRITKIK